LRIRTSHLEESTLFSSSLLAAVQADDEEKSSPLSLFTVPGGHCTALAAVNNSFPKKLGHLQGIYNKF
jgi:hypothetical protein